MAETEPSYVSSTNPFVSEADDQLSTSGQPIHRSLRQWDAAVREAYAAQQSESAEGALPVYPTRADMQSTSIYLPISSHASRPVQSCKLIAHNPRPS